LFQPSNSSAWQNHLDLVTPTVRSEPGVTLQVAGSLFLSGPRLAHRRPSRYAKSCTSSWDFTTATTSADSSRHLPSNWNLTFQDIPMKGIFAFLSHSFTLAASVQ
ncbi:hypothetical protein LEMLEM_LOCUS4863, partial [Lemmus lemmus]